MHYRLFYDKSLITDDFHYSRNKHLMTDLIGCFDKESQLIGFLAFNKIGDSVIILFVEVLPKFRGQHIAYDLVQSLKRFGIVNLSSKVEVFAETYEGYCLFINSVEKGYLPDDTIIGGWGNADLYRKGTISQNTNR
jgi:hypothetical protein